MGSYALWNNKGGVGKSFLAFSLACEYAIKNPNEAVLVLDLCPQANTTEILLGGKESAAEQLRSMFSTRPRRSIGGYFESRLNSPFIPLPCINEFIFKPSDLNDKIPSNLFMVPGDNLLELLAEAMRGVSQLALPVDAWAKVMRWLRDFIHTFTDRSTFVDVATFIDCNPSFAVYTQVALCAADSVIVPFTADDSSRRGIENVLALLYGIASSELQGYARLSFSQRANEAGIDLPKLHTFVSNRVTYYKGKPSSAFQAKSAPIRDVVEAAQASGKRHFAGHRCTADLFAQMPDYHSVAVVASSEGCPLSRLKAGPHLIDGDKVQVNASAIKKYTQAIATLVERL